MLGLIVHFEHKEFGYEPGPRRLLFQHFHYTAKAFGVDLLCFIDVDDRLTEPEDGYIRLAKTFLQAKTFFPGCNFVMMTMGGQPIDKFIHPPNACYVIGSDYGREFKHDPSEDGDSVSIGQVNLAYPLWAQIAAGIVLYDRMVRQ